MRKSLHLWSFIRDSYVCMAAANGHRRPTRTKSPLCCTSQRTCGAHLWLCWLKFAAAHVGAACSRAPPRCRSARQAQLAPAPGWSRHARTIISKQSIQLLRQPHRTSGVRPVCGYDRVTSPSMPDVETPHSNQGSRGTRTRYEVSPSLKITISMTDLCPIHQYTHNVGNMS